MMRRHAWAFDLFGIAALATVFFLAACSNNGLQGGPGGPGAEVNPMGAAQPCAPQFMQEFNGLRQWSQNEWDRSRVYQACNGFKQKYAGMRCTVDDVDYTTYQRRSYTIDAGREMDLILNQSTY